MTEPVLTPEDIERDIAKEAAQTPPEIIPDAADLPDDVRDGDVEGETHPSVGQEVISEPKED